MDLGRIDHHYLPETCKLNTACAQPHRAFSVSKEPFLRACAAFSLSLLEWQYMLADFILHNSRLSGYIWLGYSAKNIINVSEVTFGVLIQTPTVNHDAGPTSPTIAY